MKVGQSSWSADRLFPRSKDLNQQRVVRRKGGTCFVVPLFKSRLSEALPAIRPIDSSSSLESNIQVATLNGEVEASTLILHEMKRDLLQGVRSTPRDQDPRTSGYPFCCK